MASSCLCASLFLWRLNNLSLSLGQTVSVCRACIQLLCLLCLNPTSTRQLHHSPKALRVKMKRDNGLIRTVLPCRAVAHGGSWPHFYYRCLTLMISSKHTEKDPAAFKPSLSHFIALTTLPLPRKVNGHGQSYIKEQCGSSHLIKGYTVSWNMERRQ